MPSQEPSYLKEMLFSQLNVYGFLLSAAAGVLLSIPYGFGVGLLPFIAFATIDMVAALFVPYSESFRASVDKRLRTEAREAQRQHLLDEIKQRESSNNKGMGSLNAYQRMLDRVSSLYRIAEDSHTRLNERDVDKLNDATLDYLSMWLAGQVIDERAKAISSSNIEARLKVIDSDIEAARPGTDQAQLQKARTEYLSLITRHRRMLSRKMALEAAMLSMPDQMDEIYQTIVTAPASAEVDSKLADSIAKLDLDEEIEVELEGMLRETVPQVALERQERQKTQSRTAPKPQAQKT